MGSSTRGIRGGNWNNSSNNLSSSTRNSNNPANENNNIGFRVASPGIDRRFSSLCGPESLGLPRRLHGPCLCRDYPILQRIGIFSDGRIATPHPWRVAVYAKGAGGVFSRPSLNLNQASSSAILAARFWQHAELTAVKSAARHHLDVWAYVDDCHRRLAGGSTDYQALLPDVWRASHPESIRQYRDAEQESRRLATQQRRTRRREAKVA